LLILGRVLQAPVIRVIKTNPKSKNFVDLIFITPSLTYYLDIRWLYFPRKGILCHQEGVEFVYVK
jgi:hypothetical protein